MKLKRAVIKEELVALTGDAIAALILNQLLYWSERVRDFDDFIEEELRRGEDPNIAPTKGWIYKSISELGEEIMLDVSDPTIRRRIDDLVAAGYLERRASPNKWDRTLQYRPHIYNIQRALFDIGYVLDGYPLQFQFESSGGAGSLPGDESRRHSDGSREHSDASRRHGNGSREHDDASREQGDASREQSDGSKRRGDGTIPEITTETTSENTNRNNNRERRPRDAPLDQPAPPGDGPAVATVADLSESEHRAFEALRAIGFEPEKLAREYATENPEAVYRWAIYARRENLGAGYVRKHLEAGDKAPNLKRPGSPPPSGRVYR